MTTKNKTQFTVSGNTITMERVFNAPRDLVFEVWSNSEHLANWFSPTDWTVPVSKLDFRPGGSWHYLMQGPDGMESWGKTLYKEIEAPERIVYTDYFSDADGNLNDEMPAATVTTQFIEQGQQTKIVSRAEYPTEADLQTVLEMGMEEGVNETWNGLEAYLATL